MPVEYVDFLTSGKLLVDGKREIDYRNSISRTYYAAFHACKKIEEHCNIVHHKYVSSRGGEHERLSSLLANLPDDLKYKDPIRSQIRSIGVILGFLKGARHTADYRLEETVSLEDTEAHLKMVDKLHEKFLRLLRDYDGPAANAPT